MNKLRAYVYIDRLQPQLAAGFAAGATGFLPIGGEAALMVEVQPGILINQAIDLSLKAAQVRPGKSFTERHFGFLEIHSEAQEEVKHAGRAILQGLGLSEQDKSKPEILSSQIINKVSPYHAQMMNIYRNGSLLLPGMDLFTMECAPAAYIALAANEVEKATNITLVDCNEVGAVGRLSISGRTSEIKRAAQTALSVLKSYESGENPMDIQEINKKIKIFKDCLALEKAPPQGETLWAGVDLGTANIVTAVVNCLGQPVAGVITRSNSSVRDGLVFDYMGTMNILRNQVKILKEHGFNIALASAAYPPGTLGRNRESFAHVLRGADLEVSGLIDEPSAAALALGISEGCVVDIGGGTTGISILENSRVIYSGDEPTGGHHLDLVIAGNLGIEIEEAEKMKNDPEHQKNLATLVLPVFQKMGTIVLDHIKGHDPKVIYLVGGTSSFSGADDIISGEVGIPVVLPDDPLLVTPLGTALHAARMTAQKAVANGE